MSTFNLALNYIHRNNKKIQLMLLLVKYFNPEKIFRKILSIGKINHILGLPSWQQITSKEISKLKI